jgi:hypothetical protein
MPNRLFCTCALISLVGFGSLAAQGLDHHQALPAARAAPQQIPPPVRPGEPYGRAQQRLLAKGWRPQPRPPRSSCSILQSDQRCAVFHWLSPRGQSWALITVGGTPQGDPGAISTWFVIR